MFLIGKRLGIECANFFSTTSIVDITSVITYLSVCRMDEVLKNLKECDLDYRYRHRHRHRITKRVPHQPP